MPGPAAPTLCCQLIRGVIVAVRFGIGPGFLPPPVNHANDGTGMSRSHDVSDESDMLAHPASIDNVPTSGGKEDHVSMGMTAAVKLRRIVENAEHVLAIELLAAAEALEYRRPLRSGRGVERVHDAVRSRVQRLTEDRALSDDIQQIADAIREGYFEV